MTVPVVWLSWPAEGKEIARFYWDQAEVERLCAHALRRPAGAPDFTHHDDIPPDADGVVLVVPGRFHHGQEAEISAAIAELSWVLLIVTSDEESLFDASAVTHPRIARWVQTPRPDAEGADRWLPFCPPPQVGDALGGTRPPTKDLDWFFAGQVTHDRRYQMLSALQRIDRRRSPGKLIASRGFAQGLDPESYVANAVRAKAMPAPTGPATVDSFRAFEALDCGAVPVLDGWCPTYGDAAVDYWRKVLGDHPLPVVSRWESVGSGIRSALPTAERNRVQAWWLRWRRELAVDFADTIARLSGETPEPTIDDLVTVLMPTSPIPSHPSTEIVEATVASIRERLPEAEILLLVDGVRDELAHRADDYAEYVRRVLWLSAHVWRGVTVLLSDEHLHQGVMTRRALDVVRTPLVLFCEHDTPLVGDIPFGDLADVVISGDADVIRLHHEAEVLDAHRHMMIDRKPKQIRAVRLMRTFQWSQRPHLASAAYYRRICEEFFGWESRTMIEDVMHGVCEVAYHLHRMDGWRRHKVWLYTPVGDIKRSTHLDGRGDDPKFDDRFRYAYDGEVPEGAPHPSVNEGAA